MRGLWAEFERVWGGRDLGGGEDGGVLEGEVGELEEEESKEGRGGDEKPQGDRS